MRMDLAAFSRSIGHEFRDKGLIRQALTHRSCSVEHNERLEFLGDSILNLVVGEYLYRRYPKAKDR